MTTHDIGLEVAERVLVEIGAVSRKPFQRQLAKLLGCGPSMQAIRDFAEKHPDRWAQAVAIFAPLAGIQRDAPIQVNVFNVSEMSDIALMARAQALGIPVTLPALPSNIPIPPIDAEVVEVSNRQQLGVSPDVSPGETPLPEGSRDD